MSLPSVLAPLSPINTILALNITVHTIQTIQTAYGRDKSRPVPAERHHLHHDPLSTPSISSILAYLRHDPLSNLSHLSSRVPSPASHTPVQPVPTVPAERITCVTPPCHTCPTRPDCVRA